MKSLSSALVVLGGLGTVSVGMASQISNDEQIFVVALGLVVAAAGLVGWFRSLRQPS